MKKTNRQLAREAIDKRNGVTEISQSSQTATQKAYATLPAFERTANRWTPEKEAISLDDAMAIINAAWMQAKGANKDYVWDRIREQVLERHAVVMAFAVMEQN